VVDEAILQPYKPIRPSVEPDFDQQVLKNFNKLKDLVSALDHDVHQAYIQQSNEVYPLTIATSSSSSKSVHPTSVGTTSSVIYTTHSIVSQVVTQSVPTNSISSPPLKPNIMATHYAPLVLPSQLHDMPQDYHTRIPQFEGTISINAQQHIDRIGDYFDLHEIDHNYIKLRPFSDNLGGEVKKWFKKLNSR